jgi:hypothetical protein|tara:strand:+ start:66 stop:263 length:198 start_codon:yes stop_codon:yes gene_type:complete
LNYKKNLFFIAKCLTISLVEKYRDEIEFAAKFYSTIALGKNEVRIAYVLNTEYLISSVAILKAAL